MRVPAVRNRVTWFFLSLCSDGVVRHTLATRLRLFIHFARGPGVCMLVPCMCLTLVFCSSGVSSLLRSAGTVFVPW